MATNAGNKLSREEYRRRMDLEAARKAGTAPAEVDEEGRAINPHIPQYIAQAPWYMDIGRPSLSHQRTAPEYDNTAKKFANWYDRSVKGQQATKFRKGACTNCGAMGHNAKDCVERPRKRGAAKTNKDIAADDVIMDVGGNYEAKRDRWNGYDPAEHKRVYDEYTAVEAARQKIREEEIDKAGEKDLAVVAKTGKGKEKKPDDDFGSSEDEDEDEDKYADAADAVGQKVNAKTRVTVRNLRIREDTAKYLLNLDVDSAHYDPKTRSMREAPNRNVSPEDATFAGDNFARHSGDATNIQTAQLFAWQSAARGHEVHLQANPTAAALAHDEFKVKKDELRDTNKVGILDRYGGGEYLDPSRVPRELRTGQTEEYVEYSRTGAVIKGRERAKARSKYDEDFFPGNHTSVWGSWYDTSSRGWAYACCHSAIFNSYCQGAAGIEAAKASTALTLLESKNQDEPTKSLADQHAERLARGEDVQRAQPNRARHAGDADGEVVLDKDRLRKALEEERKRKRGDDEDWGDDRKKKWGASGGAVVGDVTEEELEAYRMSRDAGYEDPMANLKGDELLPLDHGK